MAKVQHAILSFFCAATGCSSKLTRIICWENRGGRLCVYINKSWCTNCFIISSHCSKAAEDLIVKCQPHYLTLEFTAEYIVAVYFPLSAKASKVLEELYDNICSVQNKHLKAFIIITDNFNHINLMDILPGFFLNMSLL